MADADLKPSAQHAERCVTVQQSQRYQPLSRFKPGVRRNPRPSCLGSSSRADGSSTPASIPAND